MRKRPAPLTPATWWGKFVREIDKDSGGDNAKDETVAAMQEGVDARRATCGHFHP